MSSLLDLLGFTCLVGCIFSAALKQSRTYTDTTAGNTVLWSYNWMRSEEFVWTICAFPMLMM